MSLPEADAQLVQIMDAALADATRRAGAWLACRPGCTQCCHGAFAINALDSARLRTGMDALRAANPQLAAAVQHRAKSWLATFSPAFPGDPATGLLGTSDHEQALFEDFADDAPCPALNPQSGLCDVYEWRPMICRVFGPPTRIAQHHASDDAPGDFPGDSPSDPLACCELCFVGASQAEIAACEMTVPRQFEEQLVAETGHSGETVVAFALLQSAHLKLSAPFDRNAP